LSQNYTEEIVQSGDSLVDIGITQNSSVRRTGKPGARAFDTSSLIQVSSDLRIKDEEDDDAEETLRAATAIENGELIQRQGYHM
jgi:hypothetical protein